MERKRTNNIDGDVDRLTDFPRVNRQPEVLFNSPPCPTASQISDNSQSSEEHVHDDQWGPHSFVSHAHVMTAAERHVRSCSTKSSTALLLDSESDDNCLLGPHSQRRKRARRSSTQDRQSQNRKKLPWETSNKKPSIEASAGLSTAPTTRQVIAQSEGLDEYGERVMTTVERAPTARQKLLTGFPHPDDPFPRDFDLVELCFKYPNHLFGVNLQVFIQQGWSAAQIMANLPSQDHIPLTERLTKSVMASRLRTARVHMINARKIDSRTPSTPLEAWISLPQLDDMALTTPILSSDIGTDSVVARHSQSANIGNPAKQTTNPDKLENSSQSDAVFSCQTALIRHTSNSIHNTIGEEILESDEESGENQYRSKFKR